MSLIFYDTETTGTDPFFDQILQFAAIRTDDEFNEIERFNIRCRLLPHIVPHPKAMLVTGVTADMLTDATLPSHYEMMSTVSAKLASWGASVFIGYNSLRFDEAMLRSAFYQSLRPIYLTNTNGNGRADALRLAQAASVFAPDAIRVPMIDGKPTFKLDRLAPEHGFAHANAHDALADVEATIFVTKKIADAAPDLWRRVHAAADKRKVTTFVTSGEPFLLTDFYFNEGHSWPVAWIGDHPEKPNLAFAAVLDDRFDELAEMNPADLQKAVGSSPRPIRRIKTNASPLLTSFDKLAAHPQFNSVDIDGARRRAARLQSDEALRERLRNAILSLDEPFEQDPDAEVEERIYEGFYSRDDERRIYAFHAAPWPERAEIAKGFSDARLKLLAKRVIYAANPALLPEADRIEFERSIAQRYSTEEIEPAWLTPRAALAALDDLEAEANETEKSILKGLRVLYLDRAGTFGVSG